MSSSATSPGHLDDATWERLACDELSTPEADAALRHIQACAECTTVHRGVGALRQEAPRFDSGAPGGAALRRRRPMLVAAALAAAAVVVAALVLPGSLAVVPLRSAAPAGEPVAVAPVGPLSAAPGLFQWQAVPGVALYRVSLLGADGAVVWASEPVPGTSLAWPSEVVASPGKYFWQLTAYPNGPASAGVTSALRDFEVR